MLWNGPFRTHRSPTTDKLRQWRVWAEDGEIITETGNVGGALNLSIKQVQRTKGIRTRDQEAIIRAKRLDKKKAKEGWKIWDFSKN